MHSNERGKMIFITQLLQSSKKILCYQERMRYLPHSALFAMQIFFEPVILFQLFKELFMFLQENLYHGRCGKIRQHIPLFYQFCPKSSKLFT